MKKSENFNKGIERREFPRRHSPIDVLVRKVDEPQNYAGGATVVDSSQHGACLLTYKNFNVDDEIFIDLKGKHIAIGKIVSQQPDWDIWDRGGLLRLNVMVIEPAYNWLVI